MVHEEPPDQIVLVAQAAERCPCRREQQAGVLDPAAGQHVATGDKASAPTIFRAGDHFNHPAARGDQLDGVDVQEQPDAVGGVQLAPIGSGEVGRPAMAVADRLDDVRRLAGAEVVRRWLETPVVELTDGRGTPVERLQVIPPEWPAGVAQPRPRLEVDGIHWPALGRPPRGAATEHAQPGPARREALPADVPAVIEPLRDVAEGLAATGEHRDAQAAARQLAGDRDPGGTGADDAEIGFDRGAVG